MMGNECNKNGLCGAYDTITLSAYLQVTSNEIE